MAAKSAVTDPMRAVATRAVLEASNKVDDLIIKYTPAVTIVAACIRADTGVGPSIASGSHVWRPTWADLPTAPTSKSIGIAVLISPGQVGNTVKKLILPYSIHKSTIAATRAASPTLLTSIAFIAALLACILPNQ